MATLPFFLQAISRGTIVNDDPEVKAYYEDVFEKLMWLENNNGNCSKLKPEDTELYSKTCVDLVEMVPPGILYRYLPQDMTSEMVANDEGEMHQEFMLCFHDGYGIHACVYVDSMLDDLLLVTKAAFKTLDCNVLKYMISKDSRNPFWHYMYALVAPVDDRFAQLCLRRVDSLAKENKAYLYLQTDTDRAEVGDKLDFGLCRMKVCKGCCLAAAKCQLCAGCRKAQYCSVACQKKHWKRHKRECH